MEHESESWPVGYGGSLDDRIAFLLRDLEDRHGVRPGGDPGRILRMLVRWVEGYGELAVGTNVSRYLHTDEVLWYHFYDSIAALCAFLQRGGRAGAPALDAVREVADVGSGAGVPGMLLAIWYEHWHVTLLDARLKKVSFMRELAACVGLSNVECIHARVPDPRLRGHRYDLVCARALGNPSRTLETTEPLARTDGLMLYYATATNVAEYRRLVRKRGLWSHEYSYRLPRRRVEYVAVACGRR